MFQRWKEWPFTHSLIICLKFLQSGWDSLCPITNQGGICFLLVASIWNSCPLLCSLTEIWSDDPLDGGSWPSLLRLTDVLDRVKGQLQDGWQSWPLLLISWRLPLLGFSVCVFPCRVPKLVCLPSSKKVFPLSHRLNEVWICWLFWLRSSVHWQLTLTIPLLQWLTEVRA